MKYSFLNLAEDVLKSTKRPMDYKEIWDEGVKLGVSSKISTSGKTPWATLGAKIYVDIRDNPNTIFEKVSTRPTLFGIKKVVYNDTKMEECESPTIKYKEIDLHPVLVKYLDSNQHFKCLTKTINQSANKPGEKSISKNANMWVYSDLIGIYFPFDDFDETSLKTMQYLNENPYKIFSFEMKKKINFSNFKEYYFQAVSNSSWANEGYLGCDELLDDPDLINELRILNSSHGIGLIVLNKENPEQSEILFSSRFNEKLDIYMLNKLITQNKDVEEVFKYVNDSCKIGKKVGSNVFDKVLNDTEYHDFVLKKFGISI